MIDSLAALAWYAEQPKSKPGGKKPSFEAQELAVREAFTLRTQQFLEALEKCNKMVVPLVTAEQQRQRHDNWKERGITAVREVFKGVTLWKREAMPVEELVLRVINAQDG